MTKASALRALALGWQEDAAQQRRFAGRTLCETVRDEHLANAELFDRLAASCYRQAEAEQDRSPSRAPETKPGSDRATLTPGYRDLN